MNNLKIMAVVGSLRAASVNAATAQAAIRLAPAGVSIELFDIRDIPLYDGDVEEAGLPATVAALHDAVGAADGLLFFSPEYNSSFPAVTKNAIDWMTRPPKSWVGAAVAIVVTTPGPRAGQGIREHAATMMSYQPIRYFDSYGIGSYGDKFEAGELVDEEALAELGDYLERFAEFCRGEE